VKTRLLVLGVIVVAGIVAALVLAPTYAPSIPSPFSSPNRPSSNVYIVMGQSSCTAHLSNFNCTLVLSTSTGQINASDISSVKINGTAAQLSGVTATPDSVSVNAGISIVAIKSGLNDVNNVPPVTIGEVVVYLKDGTTVSATIPGQYAE
jgi:hypothetical protein